MDANEGRWASADQPAPISHDAALLGSGTAVRLYLEAGLRPAEEIGARRTVVLRWSRRKPIYDIFFSSPFLLIPFFHPNMI